jgi:hypothetical protein
MSVYRLGAVYSLNNTAYVRLPFRCRLNGRLDRFEVAYQSGFQMYAIGGQIIWLLSWTSNHPIYYLCPEI